MKKPRGAGHSKSIKVAGIMPFGVLSGFHGDLHGSETQKPAQGGFRGYLLQHGKNIVQP